MEQYKSFDDLITAPTPRGASIVTIMGEPGCGKTTFAATWNKPIFLRAEDGTEVLTPMVEAGWDIKQLPIVKTIDDVWDQCKYLAYADHDRKTVVVDSVTSLNEIFLAKVLEKEDDEAKRMQVNTAFGGYGAAYNAASAHHKKLRDYADKWLARGMNVVFIAHIKTKEIMKPEGQFITYSIDMSDVCKKHYTRHVMLVGFLRKKILVSKPDEKVKEKTKEKNTARSAGNIELICKYDPVYQTKNQYHITNDFTVEEYGNPLWDIIPGIQPE